MNLITRDENETPTIGGQPLTEGLEDHEGQVDSKPLRTGYSELCAFVSHFFD